MSAQNRTEQKSLAPAGLEDKSLAPEAVENKSATPEVDGKVSVVLAHPVPAGRIGNEKDLAPGDEFSTTKYLATQLVQQGVARLA